MLFSLDSLGLVNTRHSYVLSSSYITLSSILTRVVGMLFSVSYLRGSGLGEDCMER